MTPRLTEHAARKKIVRVARAAFSVSIAVGIFALIIPKFASYGSVLGTVNKLTVLQFFGLLLAMVFAMVTCWWQMQAAMPGLTLSQAALTNQTGTTISNIVPGGGIIAFGVVAKMFRSWGFSRSAISIEISTAGIWNTFMKLGLPIAALALLGITGRATASQVIPALIGVFILIGVVLLFTLALWKQQVARAAGRAIGVVWSILCRLLRKPVGTNCADNAVRFREKTIGLVRSRWLALTASTVVSHIALFAVLLMSLRFVGVMPTQVTGVQVLAVFAFARLLSAAPFTPGGVGVVELALIGGLYAAGHGHPGASPDMFRAQITAATLLFRTLTYGLQIPIGGVTYVLWRHSLRARTTRVRVPRAQRVPVPAAD